MSRAGKVFAALGIWLAVASGAAAAAPAAPSEPLTGTVFDQSGSVIPGARVTVRKDGSEVARTVSGAGGEFTFPAMPRGRYDLEVGLDGFETYKAEVRPGGKKAPIKVTLRVAELAEEVVVGAEGSPTRSDANRDAVTMDREALAMLPALDDNPIAALAGFLDPGTVGAGGPMLVVDGNESSRVRVPPSAIAEVKINQNPYSAEYVRPGRGRVEIVTRPPEAAYHGSVNASLRDARLDAKDFFADDKPDGQRRRFDGFVVGPLPGSTKTRFRLSLQRRDDETEALVVATGPSGPLRANVPTPRANTEFTFRLDRPLGARHSVWAEYALEDNRWRQGVGGFALADVASDQSRREHDVELAHQFLASPGFVSQLDVQVEWNHGSTRSLNPGPRRVVSDSFISGGAQADQSSHAVELRLSENVTWSKGKHLVKAGFQAADISSRTSDDRTNREGTFYYSSVADFELGRPYAFTRQTGDGLATLRPVALGGYVQDEVQVRPDLSVAAGLRYDHQNLSGHGMFSPRVFAAYAPGKSKVTIRAGAGLFADRVPPVVAFDVLRFDGRHLASILMLDPGSDDPAQVLAGPAQPVNLVRFADDLRLPYTIQYSLGAEWQVSKATSVSAAYRGTRGVSAFRSRDVNAPAAPDFAVRPDSAVGRIGQIESAGRLEADAIDVAVKTRVGKAVSGLLQYTLGRMNANTTGIGFFPASSADPLAEWGPLDDDRRHRLNVVASADLRRVAKVGLALYAASGSAYSLTTGRDDNRDGLANERPAGVRRNSLRTPGMVNLDLRLARDFFLDGTRREKGPTATLGIDVFNVLNRESVTAVVGNRSSDLFGQPVAAVAARRVQLAARLNF